MAASNVNVVVITGNLTRDPELRHTGGGTTICELRVAVNSSRRDGQSGEWVAKPNYFDVAVFGARAENCATYLAKGRPVAIEGRLDWREWEAKDGSGKRQAVQIVANTVQFLGSSKSPEEAVASEEELPEEESESEAQSELDQLTREQLDARARDLGIENPERMGKKADVIAEILAAQEAYEFGEEELDESELSF